jgi:DNA repair protein RadC
MENAVTELLPAANMVCNTDAQRNKLTALFEFKNLYETIKVAENSRTYTMGSTKKATDYFKNFYAGINDKESLAIALLDASNRVIATKVVFTGTVNEAPVYPREIVKEVLFYNAPTLIMAHNHPGGTTKPSSADIMMTAKIKCVFEEVGINLIDHIIVAGDTAISLAEEGFFDFNKRVSKNIVAESKVNNKAGTNLSNDDAKSVRQRLANAKAHQVCRRQTKQRSSYSKIKAGVNENGLIYR